MKKGSGKQAVATTMAFVRLLKDLMKDREFGKRFVPIIPDEARTFGWTRSSRPRRSTTRTASGTTRWTGSCCCPTGRPRTGQILQRDQRGRRDGSFTAAAPRTPRTASR